MATQTIQLAIPTKYQNIFDKSFLSKTIMSLEDFLVKLGIDKDMMKEIIHINRMKNDIQNKHYTTSRKL